MINRLSNGVLGTLKVKAVLTNTQNKKKKVKNKLTIIILFVPLVVTTSQLTTNISEKPLSVVMTAVQLVTKTWKHRK